MMINISPKAYLLSGSKSVTYIHIQIQYEMIEKFEILHLNNHFICSLLQLQKIRAGSGLSAQIINQICIREN